MFVNLKAQEVHQDVLCICWVKFGAIHPEDPSCVIGLHTLAQTPQEPVLFDVSSSEWLDMSNPEELLLF